MEDKNLSTNAAPECMVSLLRCCFIDANSLAKAASFQWFALHHMMQLLYTHSYKTSKYILPHGVCSYKLYTACSLQVVAASIYYACGRFKK